MEFELAQKSVNIIENHYETKDIMKDLCRKVDTEGCVLLENDRVLPINNKKIALFGRCQINTFYAGYGSGGDVKSPYKVSILDGLLNNGANLDESLVNKYQQWTNENVPNEGTWGCWPLCFEEMPLNEKTVIETSKNNDLAIYILGRSAGEDRDIKLEKGSWYLNDLEKEVLTLLRKHFEKLVVLINSGSIMDTAEILEFNPSPS